MLRAEREAHPILVTLAVALTEAILQGEVADLPAQVVDVLHEWLETPHGQSHFAVQEMPRDMRKQQPEA